MGILACFLIVFSLVERSSVVAVALGQDCSDSNEHCTDSDSNSECDSETTRCICTAGYTEESTVCKVKIDNSTTCSDTDECPTNAECTGQCSCNSGYREESFLCTHIIGMSCADDCDCQDVLPNTVCTSYQCECAAGFSGLACSFNGALKLSTTTKNPITTTLLAVIYKYLIWE